ncbi:threonine dehydratase [Rhodothalassium salexigens DSM 2132]|uniref:Threonine dehydratase n=1 Tax=Rhodothalassium salexigens DSM 2132 TaxID=1188247 RepID=A0A4R2PHI6_RHOSA|nr:threonine ammonia-lyase [Rhodothalassium salexigens]MBB4212011.1 threonine dehydratase [Rhodothalassium salexigens DSM 2132]MBK1638503.1 threonine ammonia-lyase [Rhodothalassium salexigens DSM 2132]TCP33405.1 threonine dehydratase [Rhodothalassium salexigens DSM 2132]
MTADAPPSAALKPAPAAAGGQAVITIDDVRQAAETIRGAVIETPAAASATLSAILGIDIALKFEIFQFTGAFKERGALNRLLALTEAERAAGVIAMSAGNHAQGVAYHARRLGIPATIVMPRGTPFTKIRGTEDLGANVVVEGASLVEAAAAAERLRAAGGLTFIHPYDDPLVIAGQGTVALEFLAQVPDLDRLVVPIGGGGLIAGMAVAAKTIKPEIEIVGVQTEAYPSMREVLAGRDFTPLRHTIAEGIAVKTPGTLTRQIVADLVDDIVLVDEAHLETAINNLIEIEKVVVEGAGAAGLAALLQHPERFRDGKKAGLVLCGGNIDSRALVACVSRQLERDGRLSRLRVIALDQPGSLAETSRIVAEAGANVLEVFHRRQFATVPVKYIEFDVVVETKDRQHTARLIDDLERQGIEVENITYLERPPRA